MAILIGVLTLVCTLRQLGMAVRGFDVIYTEIDMFLPEINRGDIRVLLRDKRRRRRGGNIKTIQQIHSSRPFDTCKRKNNDFVLQ